jgi:uncharacterized protein YgiM (DUF1202 family)
MATKPWIQVAMKSFESLGRLAGRLLFALLALTFLATARAEQMFVIDKVVLNVYAEPNQDSGRIAMLETGDTVEALDRLEGYVHVRLADSREGWVRANFLSVEAPAVIRLKELQSGQPPVQQTVPPQLAEEVARLKKQNITLQGELDNLRKQAATPPAPVAAAAVDLIPAQPQAAALRVPTLDNQSSVDNKVWLWPALTGVSGAIGFFFGYQALARRIRRKYGNVRIY